MNMWFERNKIRQEFQNLLIASPVRNKDIIYLDDIHGLIPTELTQGLIQITEKCISLTDDLCSEFNNFLSNFNDSVEAKLNKTIKSQFLVNLYTFPKELNSNRLEIINREIEPQWTELLPYFRSLSDYELFVESMCSVYTSKQTNSSKPVSFSPFSPSFHAISEPNVIETTFSLRL